MQEPLRFFNIGVVMKNQITFTKSYQSLILIFGFLCLMLFALAYTTGMFTTILAFQGNYKITAAFILIIPTTPGILMILFVFLRFPRQIQVNKETATITFDNVKIDNPVEITITSNHKQPGLYQVILKSKGKQKLKTGFIYKNDDELKSYSFSDNGSAISIFN